MQIVQPFIIAVHISKQYALCFERRQTNSLLKDAVINLQPWAIMQRNDLRDEGAGLNLLIVLPVKKNITLYMMAQKLDYEKPLLVSSHVVSINKRKQLSIHMQTFDPLPKQDCGRGQDDHTHTVSVTLSLELKQVVAQEKLDELVLSR